MKGENVDDPLKRELLLAELEEVRSLAEDGLLRPENVVAWARQHHESQLFQHLNWDDTDAAEKYRVDQVRQLIRVVIVQSEVVDRKVRAFVSTPADRSHGGGYRPVDDALRRARQDLVNDALKSLVRMRNRFTHLPELASVFDAVDKAVKDYAESHSQREAG